MSGSIERAPNPRHMRKKTIDFKGNPLEVNPVQGAILELVLTKALVERGELIRTITEVLQEEARDVQYNSIPGATSNQIHALNSKLPLPWHITFEKMQEEQKDEDKRKKGRPKLKTFYKLENREQKSIPPQLPHSPNVPPSPPPHKGREEILNPDDVRNISLDTRYKKLTDNPESIMPSDRPVVLFVLNMRAGETFTPSQLLEATEQSDRVVHLSGQLSILNQYGIRVRQVKNPDGSISFERVFI